MKRVKHLVTLILLGTAAMLMASAFASHLGSGAGSKDALRIKKAGAISCRTNDYVITNNLQQPKMVIVAFDKRSEKKEHNHDAMNNEKPLTPTGNGNCSHLPIVATLLGGASGIRSRFLRMRTV